MKYLTPILTITIKGICVAGLVLTGLSATGLSPVVEAAAKPTFVTACLRAKSGKKQYLSASRNKKKTISTVKHCRGWEKFQIEDINGGKLMSGDYVYIKTAHGKYMSASKPRKSRGVKKGVLHASVPHKKAYEKFKIIDTTTRYGGGEQICGRDTVVLESTHGTYVVAEDGGAKPAVTFWSKGTFQTGRYHKFVIWPTKQLCKRWDQEPLALTGRIDGQLVCFRDGGVGECDLRRLSYMYYYNARKRTIHTRMNIDKCLEFNDGVHVKRCTYKKNQQWLLKTNKYKLLEQKAGFADKYGNIPGPSSNMRSAASPKKCVIWRRNSRGGDGGYWFSYYVDSCKPSSTAGAKEVSRNWSIFFEQVK